MQVFNLKSIKAALYKERRKNVFFTSPRFKMRIIELKPNDKIPSCDMKSYVVFNVIEGSAEITIDKKMEQVNEGDCVVSEPGTFSMQSRNGARILGIQIFK